MVGSVLLALTLLMWATPAPCFGREASPVYYLDIRGDESIKAALLAQFASRPCFEEADLRSLETYVTDKAHGGECHAFREFRRSPDQHHTGHYLLRIDLKPPVRGRRRYSLRGYFVTAKKFEQVFNTGTSAFPEARFVKDAANEIAVRTFQLRPEPERLQEPIFME